MLERQRRGKTNKVSCLISVAVNRMEICGFTRVARVLSCCYSCHSISGTFWVQQCNCRNMMITQKHTTLVVIIINYAERFVWSEKANNKSRGNKLNVIWGDNGSCVFASLTLSRLWISRTPTRTMSRSLGNSNDSFNSIVLRPELPSYNATRTLIKPQGEKAILFLLRTECKPRILKPKKFVASTISSTGCSFFGKRWLSCATCSASLIIVYKETGAEISTSAAMHKAISFNFFIISTWHTSASPIALNVCNKVT